MLLKDFKKFHLDEEKFIDLIDKNSSSQQHFLLELGINKAKQILLASEGLKEQKKSIEHIRCQALNYFYSQDIEFYYTYSSKDKISILFRNENGNQDKIAQRISTQINDTPYQSESNNIYYPRISIGVTDIAGKAEHTLIRSEEAFKIANNIDSGNVAFLYQNSQKWEDTLDSLLLLPEINRIIHNSDRNYLKNHLVLHYQDIVDLSQKNNRLNFEILSRFYLDEGTLIYPDKLFDSLEKNKSSGSFDFTVFELAYESLEKLELNNIKYNAAINISEANIAMPKKFFTHIDYYQLEHRINPENIWLEISEKCNVDLSNFVMEAYERGYNISYDDYGKGGTNLSKLKDEVLENSNGYIVQPSKVKLKIDKEYISELQHCSNKGYSNLGLILLTLRVSADYPGLEIVAEGIENKELEEKIKKLSFSDPENNIHTTVRYGQGFYYNKPQVLDELIEREINKVKDTYKIY